MVKTAAKPDHGLVGCSPAIADVRRLIGKAARTKLPVLLLGESGTGKEVVARAIHEANPRGRLVPIDCGSLVGTLMESELFGHVKGSFSGAVENKKGLVEAADGGTAFFDEIGDLPLEMQVKLLRLVQESEFRPVGALQIAQGRPASDRRHAPRSQGPSRRRALPPRSVLPPQRATDPPPAATRSQGRHPAAGRAFRGAG